LTNNSISIHFIPSTARGGIPSPSLSQQQCGGVRRHEKCRLLIHVCFPVNRGSKVKGQLGRFGTFGNARANPYLQNPVVRSQEESIVLNRYTRREFT